MPEMPDWTEHEVAPQAATIADQDAYKRLSSSAAKGIAVITARHGGWDYAVTITDYLSVSYDPPTMLASLYSLSRMAETLADCRRWALSVLASDQRAIADVLGSQGSPLIELLGQIPHVRRSDDGPPLISGALSWFELQTVAAQEAATHTLFIGEVLAMGRAAPTTARPLVHFRSGYLR